VAHVGVGDGVVARQRVLAGAHVDPAAHAAAALLEIFAVPLIERQADLEPDLRGDIAVDLAIGGQAGGCGDDGGGGDRGRCVGQA
jgi:hypothetical protein